MTSLFWLARIRHHVAKVGRFRRKINGGYDERERPDSCERRTQMCLVKHVLVVTIH